MKPPVIILITCLLITVILLLNSCQKEYSCEDCIGNNHPPIAVAGPDTLITLPRDCILLDGSKSGDPDGKISAWQWTKIKGPASLTIVSAATAITTVKNLKGIAIMLSNLPSVSVSRSHKDSLLRFF